MGLGPRPGRQTLMFSATWGPDVQRLAEKYLTNPQRVVVNAADVEPGATEVCRVLRALDAICTDNLTAVASSVSCCADVWPRGYAVQRTCGLSFSPINPPK